MAKKSGVTPKSTKLKDIREVGEAKEDSPPSKTEESGADGAAMTEEQILGLIWKHESWL